MCGGVSFGITSEISPSARSKREEDNHEQHHHERSKKKGQRKLADSAEIHATEEFDKPSKDISVNDKRASDPVLRERGGLSSTHPVCTLPAFFCVSSI